MLHSPLIYEGNKVVMDPCIFDGLCAIGEGSDEDGDGVGKERRLRTREGDGGEAYYEMNVLMAVEGC